MKSKLSASERQPLLGNQGTVGLAPTPLPLGPHGKKVPARRLGPLEIDPTTRGTILAGVWLGTFLTATTLVATLLGSISSEFKASHQASWLGTAFLLASCTFTPLYGRLCHVMGRRGANQMAVVFTGLGTLGCGLSTTMPILIASRFFTGFGAGGLLTTGSIIVSDMYTMRDRSMTAGIASIFIGLGMGLGGPLGGWISDQFGWRWAFLMQLPLFVLSFLLTSRSLHYVTPGKGGGAWDALKRVDYAGSLSLMIAVGSLLGFLSFYYNEDLDINHPYVITTLALTIAFFIIFVIVELYVAKEPVLAPSLLRQPVPALVGLSSVLVSQCNFAVMYFFPLWFESVQLTSASEAGSHLFPNAISMSLGSLFAGWIMQRTGKYKTLNVVFGIFPTASAVLIANLKIDSSPLTQWLSIVPLGFGNAVVLQTTYVPSQSNFRVNYAASQIAVGTGFSQLFRGIGQVCGVAGASAIFQAMLTDELRQRITGPGAEEIVQHIRHSAKLVVTLPPSLQHAAREAYAISLRSVFYFAAASTFSAFLIRLPVCPPASFFLLPYSLDTTMVVLSYLSCHLTTRRIDRPLPFLMVI
ncbi:hypothetical protein BS47DRAFT_1290213 [Hydnum rufescens UP504]|uniref:Major facilitator superfamily (MFS) profile domain-containing protein n=1 Tax=Hydnum rufescens UP504 TaxID=1448309 RepID=A0A9P6B578_9AGAM|nr:hypothetical protein BS47DRAFT_1290213 [Hydnum rufescens UP504]